MMINLKGEETPQDWFARANARDKAERCFKAPYYLDDVGLQNVEIMEGELADKTPICVIQVAYKDGNSKLFVNAETGVNAIGSVDAKNP